MTRPDYLPRGGELVMMEPLALQRCTMYSFLVEAGWDALTSMCRTQLDPVTTPSGFVYRPLLPMAAFVCADIAKSWSLTPPDSQKGWMRERDFGIWVPLAAGKEDGGVFHVERIGWYLPYVFVDNCAAMVTGREVYGFFKQIADLVMPDAPTGDGAFTVDALVIQTFSPESQGLPARLLTLTSAAGAAAPAGGAWRGPLDAFEDVIRPLKARFVDAHGHLPLPTWELVKQLLGDLVHGEVPMIFLKQFRDATEPHKACYQAVIEANAKLEAWHGGGFAHPHDVTILPADSHPIAKDLGLAGPTVRADLGFWTEIDFVMQAGREVARTA